MHSAPSVSYPVGRSRFLAHVQLVLWLLGAATVAAWCAQVDMLGWRQALALASLVCTGAFAWRGWRRMPVGGLYWDGQQWFWTGAGEPLAVTLQLHLDWQRYMLLSCQPPGAALRWCWVEQASQPQRWRDLRRAVYSPARAHAAPDSVLLSEP
nr:hypothetical protein [uncultured Albidiferax sp.]